MSNPPSTRSSTSFILSSAPRKRTNEPAIEQEKTTTSLRAADPVISNGGQPPLSSRYLEMLMEVN